MGLALGKTLKFYTSAAKGLKLKLREFLGLIPTFVEVTGENWQGGFLPPPLALPPPPIQPGIVACTCNPATLEAKFQVDVGLIPVGGNSISIGGWIV